MYKITRPDIQRRREFAELTLSDFLLLFISHYLMASLIFIQQYPGLPVKLLRSKIGSIYVRNRDKRISVKRDKLRIDISQPRIIKSTDKADNLVIREKNFSDSDLSSGEIYQNRATIKNGFDFRIPLVLRDDRDYDRSNSSLIEKQSGNLDFKKLKLSYN
jgi:hypothetical protein